MLAIVDGRVNSNLKAAGLFESAYAHKLLAGKIVLAAFARWHRRAGKDESGHWKESFP